MAGQRWPPWWNGPPATGCCSASRSRPPNMWPCASQRTFAGSPTISSDPSPGIKAKSSPATSDSLSTPVSRSTSATPTSHGSEGPTKTGTVSSASSYPKEKTSADTAKTTSTSSHANSTEDHAKHSAGTPQQNDSTDLSRPAHETAVTSCIRKAVLP